MSALKVLTVTFEDQCWLGSGVGGGVSHLGFGSAGSGCTGVPRS